MAPPAAAAAATSEKVRVWTEVRAATEAEALAVEYPRAHCFKRVRLARVNILECRAKGGSDLISVLSYSVLDNGDVMMPISWFILARVFAFMTVRTDIFTSFCQEYY